MHSKLFMFIGHGVLKPVMATNMEDTTQKESVIVSSADFVTATSSRVMLTDLSTGTSNMDPDEWDCDFLRYGHHFLWDSWDKVDSGTSLHINDLFEGDVVVGEPTPITVGEQTYYVLTSSVVNDNFIIIKSLDESGFKLVTILGEDDMFLWHKRVAIKDNEFNAPFVDALIKAQILGDKIEEKVEGDRYLIYALTV